MSLHRTHRRGETARRVEAELEPAVVREAGERGLTTRESGPLERGDSSPLDRLLDSRARRWTIGGVLGSIGASEASAAVTVVSTTAAALPVGIELPCLLGCTGALVGALSGLGRGEVATGGTMAGVFGSILAAMGVWAYVHLGPSVPGLAAGLLVSSYLAARGFGRLGDMMHQNLARNCTSTLGGFETSEANASRDAMEISAYRNAVLRSPRGLSLALDEYGLPHVPAQRIALIRLLHSLNRELIPEGHDLTRDLPKHARPDHAMRALESTAARLRDIPDAIYLAAADRVSIANALATPLTRRFARRAAAPFARSTAWLRRGLKLMPDHFTWLEKLRYHAAESGDTDTVREVSHRLGRIHMACGDSMIGFSTHTLDRNDLAFGGFQIGMAIDDYRAAVREFERAGSAPNVARAENRIYLTEWRLRNLARRPTEDASVRPVTMGQIFKELDTPLVQHDAEIPDLARRVSEDEDGALPRFLGRAAEFWHASEAEVIAALQSGEGRQFERIAAAIDNQTVLSRLRSRATPRPDSP